MPLFGPDITIDPSVYIHETAYLYGKITIGADSSVWPNVVMRSEMHEIIIGERSNIQDFVMVHVGYETPTIVGDDCSITHHVNLHGCTIGNNCLIGINATLMDGSKIGANSIVAGGHTPASRSGVRCVSQLPKETHGNRSDPLVNGPVIAGQNCGTGRQAARPFGLPPEHSQEADQAGEVCL